MQATITLTKLAMLQLLRYEFLANVELRVCVQAHSVCTTVPCRYIS